MISNKLSQNSITRWFLWHLLQCGTLSFLFRVSDKRKIITMSLAWRHTVTLLAFACDLCHCFTPMGLYFLFYKMWYLTSCWGDLLETGTVCGRGLACSRCPTWLVGSVVFAFFLLPFVLMYICLFCARNSKQRLFLISREEKWVKTRLQYHRFPPIFKGIWMKERLSHKRWLCI